MIAEGAGVLTPQEGRQQAPQDRHPVWALLERLNPSQGWATLALLLLMLLVVGNSVTTAGWVDTAGLPMVLVSAAVAGLLLSKVRAQAATLHLAGLALGFVVVVWQGASLAEGSSLVEQVQALWSRLHMWYDAARSGGISTDLLPFSMAILTAGWLLGYLGSWFTFRRNNVWPAVVLAGIAILTNMSFLPEAIALRFFAFVLLAMLLIVRIGTIQRQEEWQKGKVGFSPLAGWLTVHSALWFSVLVLALAALLPLKIVVSRPAAELWIAARSPVASMEDVFNRLFAGIASKKDLSGRFFGTTLPFLGKISFGGEVVFSANTEYPSFWLSRTYSEYTPLGWIAGDTRTIEVGPTTLQPPGVDGLKRVPMDQALRLDFSTTDFLSGGTLDWVSHGVKLETLEPKQFEIDLMDPSKDSAFPADIQQLSLNLRQELDPRRAQFVESYISRVLPSDLVLVQISPDGAAEDGSHLKTVTLARKEPITPEIVAWEFTEQIPEHGVYSMVSLVSVATNANLREAETDYHGFITDHYLQLPPGLPSRVRTLAELITIGANTPIDKALLVQNHLRGPAYEYSRDIDAPPAEADGVDHFLFETKTGYSDYYASAMAVLLRSVGVPSRLAAGYAPGEEFEEVGHRFVRDTDSHAWVQVYFPKYGWIDFEPTPNWPIHNRGLDNQLEAELAGTAESSALGSIKDDPTPCAALDRETLECLDIPSGGRVGLSGGGPSWNPTGILIPLAIALGSLGTLWFASMLVWNTGLRRASAVETAYTKMSRLGRLAGFKRDANQTPTEYSAALGTVLPAIAAPARQIGRAFSADRYGMRGLAEEDQVVIGQAWKSIRLNLMRLALRRLVPKPGG